MSRSESRQRTELVGVRLTPEELDLATERAVKAGLTIPEYLRELLAAGTGPRTGINPLPPIGPAQPLVESWMSALGYRTGEAAPEDEAVAEMVLTMLADARALMEPGGKTRKEYAHRRRADGMVWPRRDRADALRGAYDNEKYGIDAVERTVIEWPNGTELVPAWQAIER